MKSFKPFISALVLPLVIGASLVNPALADVLSTTFYHNDALGSPVAATDENGEVKWREQYRPYGEKIVNDPEAMDNSRWYTGHPHDEETGLTYAGARYYDPVVGRFMGVDPVGAMAAVDNPMMFNRYAYGNNNPYKYVDPDGEEAVQLSIHIRAPKVLGLVQRMLGREVRLSGIDLGIAFSGPNKKGEGEFDLGIFSSLELNSEGLSTGRLAVGLQKSIDSSASVKDIAGISSEFSADFGAGGPDISFNDDGVESVGFHIGLGAGASGSAKSTSVISLRHRKIFGFNDDSNINNNSDHKDKKE